MAFAGGPLNNYVLQSTVRMAEVLREDVGSAGLVSCVSGFMNKVGYAVWSSEPPLVRFGFADVTEQVAGLGGSRELIGAYQGPAHVVGYTVAYAGDDAVEGIAVCEMEDGRRTIATTQDAELALAMTREEFCGRAVVVGESGVLMRA